MTLVYPGWIPMAELSARAAGVGQKVVFFQAFVLPCNPMVNMYC